MNDKTMQNPDSEAWAAVTQCRALCVEINKLMEKAKEDNDATIRACEAMVASTKKTDAERAEMRKPVSDYYLYPLPTIFMEQKITTKQMFLIGLALFVLMFFLLILVVMSLMSSGNNNSANAIVVLGLTAFGSVGMFVFAVVAILWFGESLSF